MISCLNIIINIFFNGRINMNIYNIFSRTILGLFIGITSSNSSNEKTENGSSMKSVSSAEKKGK